MKTNLRIVVYIGKLAETNKEKELDFSLLGVIGNISSMMIPDDLHTQGSGYPRHTLKLCSQLRNEFIQLIPTLGPTVCKTYLHWVVWIPGAIVRQKPR